MTNPRQLLEIHGIEPAKALGQNFLHDVNALDKIIQIAEVTPNDLVLEIGAGTGALTERLALAARQVVAVEIDQRLQPLLSALQARHPNLNVIYADFLRCKLSELVGGEAYLVVANVPYYITSAILRRLLEAPPRPRRMVMTVQLEVAERLVAKPGDLSLLAVSAQYYARPRIAARFKSGVFYPRPEVDSAVVRLDVYDRPIVDAPSDDLFFRVARAGFSQKRKQLKNALGDGLAIGGDRAAALIEQAGIDPRRRAETLSLPEWAALAGSVAAAGEVLSNPPDELDV